MGKKKTGLITDEVRELINEVARETASMAYIDGMGGEVNYFRAMESLLFNYKKLAALVADYEAYTHVELQGRSASISSYSPSSGYTYRTEEDILDEMKRDTIKQNPFKLADHARKVFTLKNIVHVEAVCRHVVNQVLRAVMVIPDFQHIDFIFFFQHDEPVINIFVIYIVFAGKGNNALLHKYVIGYAVDRRCPLDAVCRHKELCERV